MTRFFERKDPWGNGLALWVLAVMVFTVPLALWSVKRVDLENDVENWLPGDDPQGLVLDWYRDHFAIEDRVLVSWDEAAIDDPRIDEFARRLEGIEDDQGIRRDGSPYVTAVATPHEALQRLYDADVPREDALDRLKGILVGPGELRLAFTESGRNNTKRTRRLLSERIREELGLAVTVTEAAAPFESPTFDDLDSEPAAESEPVADVETYEPPFTTDRAHDVRVQWPGMHVDLASIERVTELALALEYRDEVLVESAFQAVGSPVAVAVVLSEAGIADRDAAFAEITEVAEAVGVPAETLHMGGRPYAGNELNRYLGKVVWNDEYPAWNLPRRSPFLASLLVGVLLSFAMLRSIRLAALVIVTAFYVMLATVALVPATGGSMNVVLVVMPTLLMVLTISAAIHVGNYWRHAVASGSRKPVVDAVDMARQPCTYAALTTAIGLASLATSPLAPVRDFGLYSAIGCVVALVVVLFGLPAMLQVWPGRAKVSKIESDRGRWRNLGLGLCSRSTLIASACGLLFVGSVVGLQWFTTETKVIRYFPDNTDVVRDYEFLENELAGIVPVEVVVRFDDTRDENEETESESTNRFLKRMEVVRAVQGAIASHPDISGTVSLASMFPVTEPPPDGAGLLQTSRWNVRSKRMENQIKGEQSDRARSWFTTADAPAELVSSSGRAVRIEPGDELWRISAQVAILSDLDYGELVGDPKKATVGQINELVRAELKHHPSTDHIVTGLVPLFLRTQQAVLESLVTSFALAFGVIAIVMMILLKSPLSGGLAMLPNLLPVGVVFGLVSWARIPVDIGTMITASVALGIAVDGTLHLLTWFQDGIRRGLSRNEAVAEGLAHCGPAMFQTSAAVGLGLLVLSAAELLLIHRFGWLMAALIFSALVADVILLPALLAGPLGRVIEGAIKRRLEAAAANPPERTGHELAPHLHRSLRSTSTGGETVVPE